MGSHKSDFTKSGHSSLWETERHIAKIWKTSGMKWGSGFRLCLYETLRYAVCLSAALPPCAPTAFPWECGLLFRTPRIASGVLLVRLMWAKQRGNKKYRNLQIIAELKTSRSFTQAHRVFSLLHRHKQSLRCVYVCIYTWRPSCKYGCAVFRPLGGQWRVHLWVAAC